MEILELLKLLTLAFIFQKKIKYLHHIFVKFKYVELTI